MLKSITTNDNRILIDLAHLQEQLSEMKSLSALLELVESFLHSHFPDATINLVRSSITLEQTEQRLSIGVPNTNYYLTAERERGFTQGEVALGNIIIHAMLQAPCITVQSRTGSLRHEVHRRERAISALHNISMRLNTSLGLKDVLNTITLSTMWLMQATCIHIYLYNPNKGDFIFGAALWSDGRRTPAVSSPRQDGLVATVAQKKQPIIINRAKEHAFFQGPTSSTWRISAIAGYPLMRDERVLGVFTIAYENPHTFDEDEQLLLSLLTKQATVAIEKARLFDETQNYLRDLNALASMAQEITGQLRVESVMKITVQILKGLLRARGCAILLLTEDGQQLYVKASAGINPKWAGQARIRIGEGVSGRAVEEQRPIYISDTQAEDNFLYFDEAVRSLLAVPLINRGQTIGALSVDSDAPHAFSTTNQQLMAIAAAQVSVAIANARLFEETENRSRELAEAYEELKESDRIKDEIVQNVSHELRTPLSFVQGYVDLMVNDPIGQLSPDQQNFLGIISEKTEEIIRLIEDILSLQRIERNTLQLEELSIARLLRYIVTLHRQQNNNKQLNFVIQSEASDDLRIEGDKGRLTQVLNNLLSNAIKFSPELGTIVVSLVEEEEQIRISVKDEGIGIPPDKLRQVFERFYQVDGSERRRYGGTGIGLAIVKRIVEAHQGQVWADSTEGIGSEFYFTLPKYAK